MDTTVNAKLFREAQEREKTKYETYTRKKIEQIQTFLSKYEEPNDENDKNSANRLKREYGDNYGKLSEFVEGLKIENRVLRETVDCLKVKNEELAGRANENAKAKEAEWKQEAKRVEIHFQGLLETKQKQLESLLGDKKQLVAQAESLCSKLVELDKTSVEKIESLKENYIDRLKKAKAEWDQQNQIKLKSWKERKTRELKDLTVKGLEPELNRLMKKADDEKANLKAHYENLLREGELNFEGRLGARMQEEREKLAAESERLLAAERQTLEKKTAMEREFYEKSMKREVETVRKLCEKEKATIENLKNKELEDLKQRIDRLVTTFDKERDEADGKRRSGEEAFRQGVRLEFDREKAALVHKYEKTIEELTSRQETELTRFKKETTQMLEAEKAEEIEMVINKMSEELLNKKCEGCAKGTGRQAQKEELEREFNLKAKELRKEIDYLNNKNQVLELKVKDLQGQCQRASDENGRKLGDYERLAIENEQLKAQNRYLENERNIIEASVNSKIEENLRLQSEAKNLKRGLETERMEIETGVKMAYEKELEKQKESFDREIEKIQQRIAQVLESKERQIVDLRDQVDHKSQLCKRYEELMRKQKEDFLKV